MIFCRACRAQSKTIQILEEQVKFLRGLLQPVTLTNIPTVEADATLTNHPEPLDYTDTNEKVEDAKYDAELSERDRLLSGNY